MTPVTRMSGNALSNEFRAPDFTTAGTATGGTLYTVGGFNYRVFTGNGTLTVSGNVLAADIHVVGAGGGGGCRRAGGGGTRAIEPESGYTTQS